MVALHFLWGILHTSMVIVRVSYAMCVCVWEHGKEGRISFPEISGRLSWIYVQIKVRDGPPRSSPSGDFAKLHLYYGRERGKGGGPFPLISQQPDH